MKSIFSVLITLAVVGSYLTHKGDAARLAEVQGGTLTLVCHIGEGDKVINPDLVTDYTDGRWYFTNGSAVQCATY